MTTTLNGTQFFTSAMDKFSPTFSAVPSRGDRIGASLMARRHIRRERRHNRAL